MLRLITTADDFGYSDDTVDATIECFEEGALTSASIMANMPATRRALDFAKSHPQFSFGVHLTFAGDGTERPASELSPRSRLLAPSGAFASARKVRLQAIFGVLSRRDIESEVRAQIETVISHGIPVVYVDSHKHLHKLEPFRSVLDRILEEYGIERVRNVQDIYLSHPGWSVTYWLGGRWRKDLMHRYRTTDHFFMPTTSGEVGWSERLVSELPAGTLEVGVHPGRSEPWRDQERKDILELADLGRRRGVELIGWHAV
jgi:hypothetical protein